MEDRKRILIAAVPNTVFFEDRFKKFGTHIMEAKLDLPEIREGQKSKPLTKDQEFRIFRKYNYLRYRVARTVIGPSWASVMADRDKVKSIVDDLPKSKMRDAESFAKRSDEFRNLIMDHNMRLIYRPVCKYVSVLDSERGESMLSNARMHLMKAVEKFDYRRGLKFSTYCVNVIQNNLLRDRTTENKRDARFGGDFSAVQHISELNTDDRLSRYDIDFISRALLSIGDKKRSVIEKLFGINCERVMFKDLALEMGVSRETVRKIKISAIKAMSEVQYDPII